MPCYTGRVRQLQQTARSMHAGGVNACFADGSVHWISDYIQVLPKPLPVSGFDGHKLSAGSAVVGMGPSEFSADGTPGSSEDY